jgi:hypothetical protein
MASTNSSAAGFWLACLSFMRLRFVLTVVALAPLSVLGETCKYLDKEGRTIYSNVVVKNARKVACFQPPAPMSTDPAPLAKAKPAEGAPAPVVDGGRTKVEPATQRKRDDDRRRILEDELAREQQALDQARKTLTEQEGQRSGEERNYQRVLDRLKPYQEAVAAHERNIASIRQEIANLR